MLDLVSKFASCEYLHVLPREELFLSAYDDDCKMDSQAKDDGPMRAAMKASGLVFKPSVPLCKMGTFDVGRLKSSLTFALISCDTGCYERVCHEAPSRKAKSNVEGLIDHPEATRDAS